ncbi:MAG: protein kinase [Pseudomonadota bacterium]
MPTEVSLQMVANNASENYVFTERTTCLIGRSAECRIQLPSDQVHESVSRFHCLLDINPPNVRVRDLGSLNGTWINDQKIGQRKRYQSPKEGMSIAFPEYELNHGDEIRVGGIEFKVFIDPGSENLETPELLTEDPLKRVEDLLDRATDGEKAVQSIQGYSIIRELGKGGMGAVYLAHDDKTGKEVALKVVLPHVAKDERAQSRFLREADNTRLLTHQNIVRLWEAGYCNETFFFTLEYCDGGSVSEMMARNGGRLDIDEAMNITFQILDALTYAHTVEVGDMMLDDGSIKQIRGLVHRDIKPSNIYLKHENGQAIAKLADFGLSKAFDMAGFSGHTATNTAAGTPKLMPREQMINFKKVRPEVDVWATAASLYNMLTGSYPRNFPPDRDPWLVVLVDSVVPIRERLPSIPPALASVIDEALIDSPSIPVSSAADLKKALEDVIA